MAVGRQNWVGGMQIQVFKKYHIKFGFEGLFRIALRHMPHTNMRLNFSFFHRLDERKPLKESIIT